MRLEEGPLFGALIVGPGVGFLTYQQSNNLGLALGVGLVVTILDYLIVVFLKTKFGKK